MAPLIAFDPARLKYILQNTGLQNSDNPLYQFLDSLLLAVNKLNNAAGSIVPAPSSTTFITNNLQFLDVGGGSGDGDGDSGLVVGPKGEDGPAGPMVPYYIALGETFTIPLYKQALFSMNIDNNGTIDIEGFLIEVD